MSEKRVLTQEIVEEIIDNLSPEEKTLDFSEFTSLMVSLEFIQERVLESFRSPKVYKPYWRRLVISNKENDGVFLFLKPR